MINSIVNEMKTVINKMQKAINDDIEDIKKANHDKLLDRNDLKLEHMNKIVELKQQLNEQLVRDM